MEKKQNNRSASFLGIMSWLYLVLGLCMIGFAIYQLSNADVQLTFRIATESVFLLIGGALGFLAGIFGLVSKNLKRCRILGLILLAIAAVPLAISLLTGEPLRIYWKYIAAMLLSFLYLIASLFKRSEKKQEPAAASAQQPNADLSQYAASSAKKKQEQQPQPAQPAPQAEKTEPDGQ